MSLFQIGMVWCLFLLGAQEEEIDPVTQAYLSFEKAEKETQRAILQKIWDRIKKSENPDLKLQLAQIETARAELKLVKKPEPRVYDYKIYAPRFKRVFADPVADKTAIEMNETFYRPWEADPPYMAVQYEYDFATDQGWTSQTLPSNEAQLQDLLFGYAPDADLLVAWLTWRWDFDDTMDPLAKHFSHVYCDLDGLAYKSITLYDAFASGNGMDMPDGDVIPFARHIMGDMSYISPLPPNAKRQRLYERIKDDFLIYFRHCTWIQAAANVYVNPDAQIRLQHKPLKKRLLYAFALDKGDVKKIRKRFDKAGNRKTFIKSMDKLAIKDKLEDKKIKGFVQKQNSARWAVANMAYQVLREYGYLNP